MRAIIAIKDSPRLAAKLINHCYKLAARVGNEVPCTDRVVSISGNIDGILLRKAAIDSFTLLSGHHGKGRPVRHAVISMEDCVDPAARAVSFKQLKKMARQFVRKFARGARYIAVVHADRWHPHVHLVVCNSVGGRTLNWTPAMLHTMQSMSWTTLATPGRGTGKNKAVKVYPLAQNLDAKKISHLTPQQLHELIATNQLSIGRVTRGLISSIIYNGRRIRLATIQRFAAPAATGAAPGEVFHPVRGLVAAAARSASLDHPPRRRRATARRRRRHMDAGRTRAVSAQPGRTTPAPTPRVAPVVRPALPGVVDPLPDQPGLAALERTQSLERSVGRGTSRPARG